MTVGAFFWGLATLGSPLSVRPEGNRRGTDRPTRFPAAGEPQTPALAGGTVIEAASPFVIAVKASIHNGTLLGPRMAHLSPPASSWATCPNSGVSWIAACAAMTVGAFFWGLATLGFPLSVRPEGNRRGTDRTTRFPAAGEPQTSALAGGTGTTVVSPADNEKGRV